MNSALKITFINLLFITLASGTLWASDEVQCYNLKRGKKIDTKDFVLESETMDNGQIFKKIYVKQNGLVSKKEAKAESNYTSKKDNKIIISDEFLIDFVLSTKMEVNKVYEVATDHGVAHFKIISLNPPISILEIGTSKGVLQLSVKNDGLNTKISEIFYEKSNLSLLPCDLDTKAKIFQNKDVNIFMGDKVAKVINK